jgi:hypothetical protein
VGRSARGAAARGSDLARFDVADLLALASSSRAALGTVRATARELGVRRADGAQPGEAPQPLTRHERRAAAKQRRFRFKRRWVVIPMVLLLLLVILVVGAIVLLVTGAIQLS